MDSIEKDLCFITTSPLSQSVKLEELELEDVKLAMENEHGEQLIHHYLQKKSSPTLSEECQILQNLMVILQWRVFVVRPLR